MEITLLIIGIVSLVVSHVFALRKYSKAINDLELAATNLKLERASVSELLGRVQVVSTTFVKLFEESLVEQKTHLRSFVEKLDELKQISEGQEQVLENFVENLLIRDEATIKFMSDVKEFTGDVTELHNFVEYVAKMDSFNGIPVISELKQSVQQLVKNAGELGKNIDKSLENK